jgi:hypothetical protein
MRECHATWVRSLARSSLRLLQWRAISSSSINLDAFCRARCSLSTRSVAPCGTQTMGGQSASRWNIPADRQLNDHHVYLKCKTDRQRPDHHTAPPSTLTLPSTVPGECHLVATRRAYLAGTNNLSTVLHRDFDTWGTATGYKNDCNARILANNVLMHLRSCKVAIRLDD